LAPLIIRRNVHAFRGGNLILEEASFLHEVSFPKEARGFSPCAKELIAVLMPKVSVLTIHSLEPPPALPE
jgi:hypothetical protein